MPWVFLCVFTLTAAPLAAAEEIPTLFRWSFEDVGEGTAPAGFSASGGGELAVSAELPHKGKHALRLSFSGEGNAAFIFPQIPLKSGRQFMLTGWFRSRRFCPGGWVDGGSSAVLKILPLDEGGKRLGAETVQFPYQAVAEWSPFTFVFQVPEKSQSLLLELDMSNGARKFGCDLFLDNILLRDVTPLLESVGKTTDPAFAFKLFRPDLISTPPNQKLKGKMEFTDDADAKYFPRSIRVVASEKGLAVAENMQIFEDDF